MHVQRQARLASSTAIMPIAPDRAGHTPILRLWFCESDAAGAASLAHQVFRYPSGGRKSRLSSRLALQSKGFIENPTPPISDML
jgi:hypothetical protein